MGSVQMKKSNRVITINETQAKGYLARGYDQLDSKGKVVKEATAGRVINPADYSKALKEIERLKEHNDKDLQVEFDKLEKAYQLQAKEHDALVESHEKLKIYAKKLKDKE